MSSVTLPPLPSMRAKEIERRQQQHIVKIQPPPENVSATTAPTVSTKPTPDAAQARTVVDQTSSSEDINKARQKRTEELADLMSRESVLSSQPPLDANLLCEAVHQYVCTTSSFLNTYVADVNAALEGVDHKLSILEKQMGMMEVRLNTVKGLMDDDEQN